MGIKLSASARSRYKTSRLGQRQLIGFLAWIFLFTTTPVFSADILIYSPTHGGSEVTEVLKPQGEMQVRVTGFSEIKKINSPAGSKVQIQGSNAQILVPFEITSDELIIPVEVITDEGKVTKEFTLQLQSAKPLVKKPFTLVSMIGVQSLDNATNAPELEVKTRGTKGVLTLNPKYSFGLFEHKVDLFMILLREKYSSIDLATQEVAFSQAGASFNSQPGTFPWKLSAGVNDIGSELKGAGAKTHIETDLFFNGEVSWIESKSLKTKLDVGYTRKNLEPVTNDLYNGDGNLASLNTGLSYTLNNYKTDLKLGVERSDTVGPYLDYGAFKGNVKLQFPALWKTRLGCTFTSQAKTFAQIDPLKGAQEKSTQSSVSINGLRPLGWAGLNLVVELKHKEQSSNVDSLNHKLNTLSLTLIHLL